MHTIKDITVAFAFVLAFIVMAVADIPAPPAANEIRIGLAKDYPGYQFYLCTFDLEVKPNPNPPHPSRPDMIAAIPGSFKLRPVELTAGKQFSEKVGDKRITYRGSQIAAKSYYLAVVRGSQTQELEPKIQEVIESGKDGNGVMFVGLEESLEAKGNYRAGATVVVNTVTMDEKGLSVKASEGTPGSTGIARNCFGLFMFAMGILMLVFWRKKAKS